MMGTTMLDMEQLEKLLQRLIKQKEEGIKEGVEEVMKAIFKEDAPAAIGMGVFAKTRFTALHSWPDAPESHAYLRQLHRHEFHVTVWASVTDPDREIEFISLKESVTAYCRETFEGKALEGVSCEMMALKILEKFKHLYAVEVSEDGENGCMVQRR